jgi:hypothetical protein
MIPISQVFGDPTDDSNLLSEIHRHALANTLEYWARQIRHAARVTGHVSQDQRLAQSDPVDGEKFTAYYPASRTLELSVTIELDQPPAESAA